MSNAYDIRGGAPMTYQLAARLAIASLVLLVGCTKHLSRSQVRADVLSTIDANKSYPCDSDECTLKILVDIGKLSEECLAEVDSALKDYDTVESDVRYKALAHTGYLTIEPKGKHVWDVALTRLGKNAEEGTPYRFKQPAHCDSQLVTLPVSAFSNLEVTGILEDGPHAKADVTVNWKLTALGRALKEYFARAPFDEGKGSEVLGSVIMGLPIGAEFYSKSITVEYDKYDDGWRKRESP